jgi:hypothetical protein
MNTDRHKSEDRLTRITLIFANSKSKLIRVDSRNSLQDSAFFYPFPSMSIRG